MPRLRNPDPLQMTLALDFGQQMDIFRTMRVGPFSHRWMMFVIWSHLGRARSTWRMSAEDLGAEMQLHPSAAVRIAKKLDTLGVLRRSEVAKGLYDFSICWGVLFGLRDEAENLCARAEEDCARAEEDCARAEEDCARAEEDCARAEEDCARAEDTIYNHELPRTTINIPAPVPEDEAMMVVARLVDAGVGQIGSTIATAEAQGMTLEQIAAVIEHYHSHPGRWPQGVLCERLTRRGARMLDAHQGWYGETEHWQREQARIEREAQARAQLTQAEETAMPKLITYPQQDFAEEKFGPLLDEMTYPQVADLVRDDLFVAKMCLKGNHRQPGMIRERCLSRMQHLAAIEREKQERQVSLATATE